MTRRRPRARRGIDVRALQAQIARTFGARDRARGLDATFRRLVEELGEVAKSFRGAHPEELALELSDVVAWTLSVAALCGVDVDRAVARYARGCPRCGTSPCRCPQDWTAGMSAERRVPVKRARRRGATRRTGAASRARATRR
ncbi:MAG TPA: MazG nucleotide pyrophosphohydrolase domain-containing protein [bacterium]|nr:MazG nucleotide pyrophosphohydrolase domain-containing protein [bacterium]